MSTMCWSCVCLSFAVRCCVALCVVICLFVASKMLRWCCVLFAGCCSLRVVVCCLRVNVCCLLLFVVVWLFLFVVCCRSLFVVVRWCPSSLVVGRALLAVGCALLFVV